MTAPFSLAYQVSSPTHFRSGLVANGGLQIRVVDPGLEPETVLDRVESLHSAEANLLVQRAQPGIFCSHCGRFVCLLGGCQGNSWSMI